MSSIIQTLLLRTYDTLNRTGFVDSRAGSWIFATSYNLYKRYVEDPHDWLFNARPHLIAHGHLIDVGANIGYTTSLMMKYTTPRQHIFAFEPEPRNFASLAAIASRDPQRVFVFQKAVSDHTGSVSLVLNPKHHADHKLADVADLSGSDMSGASHIQVLTVSLDDFVAAQVGSARVGFIKIDVQGAEHLVLAGAEKLLASENPPTLSLEFTPGARTARCLLDSIERLLGRGYAVEKFSRRGFSWGLAATSLSELDDLTDDYCDLLLTKPSSP